MIKCLKVAYTLSVQCKLHCTTVLYNKASHKTQKFLFCVATQIKYVAPTGEK